MTAAAAASVDDALDFNVGALARNMAKPFRTLTCHRRPFPQRT
jgi:hypothetical protein